MKEIQKPIETIMKGTVVAFTCGEYSDYSFLKLLRAKRDFTNDDMMSAVYASGYNDRGRFDEDKLVHYLSELECFEEIKAREIHLGDYGKLSISDYGELGR